MPDQRVQCHYHPNRLALAVCERCKRPICLEDKNVIQQKYPNTSKISSHMKSYCTICYSIEIEKETYTYQYFVIVFFFFIASLVFTLFFKYAGISLPANTDFYIISIFIPITVMALYIGYINYIKVNIAKDESKLLKFKSFSGKYESNQPGFDFDKNSEVKKPTSNEDSLPKKLKETSIICYECGAIIKRNANYCIHCGCETKDELLKKYKIFKLI